MTGLDVTPQVPRGRQLIQSYGGGRFRIAGEVQVGSVLVWPARRTPWAVAAIGDISLSTLAPVVEAAEAVDILIVGCGPLFVPPPSGLRRALSEAGMVLEWMDTGAACRTFNVLLAEDRQVAAALVAID